IFAREAVYLRRHDEEVRRGADQDVVQVDRIGPEQGAFVLRRFDELARCLVERADVPVDEPPETRPVALSLLDHEAMELGVRRGKANEVADDPTKPRDGLDVPERLETKAELPAEEREDAIGGRLPERFLARKMIRDETLVHAGTRGDVASPCPVEAALGEGL